MRAQTRRTTDPWALMELLALGVLCAVLAGCVAVIAWHAPLLMIH